MHGEKQFGLVLRDPFSKGRARILLADDHTAMVEALRKLLVPNLRSLAPSETGVHSLKPRARLDRM
jgi:hypothetical protein